MNILGMGPAELLLIFVIALIVLGPDKLPQLARMLGKATRELKRMSLEVTAEFAKELRDVEAISREVKETTETIKQAADIKRTLVEPAEPAPPSTDSGQGSEHRTADESKEEPRIPEVQKTTAQPETEKKDVIGNEGTSTVPATGVKENKAEEHE
jgi:sec-independent protein translocase protein TatB